MKNFIHFHDSKFCFFYTGGILFYWKSRLWKEWCVRVCAKKEKQNVFVDVYLLKVCRVTECIHLIPYTTCLVCRPHLIPLFERMIEKITNKYSRTQMHFFNHSFTHPPAPSLPRSLTHMWSIRRNISCPPLFANILNKFGSHIFFSSRGLPETRLAVAVDLQTIVGHTTVALLATWRLRTSSEQVPDLCWPRFSSWSCSWHLLAYTVMQGETHFYLFFNQQRTRW